MLNRSNAQGFAVLAALHELLDEDVLAKDIVIQPYVNCREQGFSVRRFAFDVQVSFSEYRKSDDIVVYSGKRNEFSMQGNVPDDEVYKGAKFFPCLDVKAAAEFIVKFLFSDNEPSAEKAGQ